VVPQQSESSIESYCEHGALASALSS
jgi:hypothetical protein